MSLPFDEHLDWTTMSTFYARYSDLEGSAATSQYSFVGDGRMPLGSKVAYRYLDDSRAELTSRVIVYHTDRWKKADGTYTTDLCAWLAECRAGTAACKTTGPFAKESYVGTVSYDDDENVVIPCGMPPACGPLPQGPVLPLESQRFDLHANGDLNPAGFRSGWTRLIFLGDPRTSQGLAWSQHKAPGGIFVTVPGTVLTYPYACTPALAAPVP